MKRTIFLSLISSLFLTSAAWAGHPIPQTMTCPIGDEKFEITSTASCSSMGHTMTLQAVTSCDFVTRLPVCPGNKLPVYKEFSEADKKELESIMASPEYAATLELSPYIRADYIEKTLSSKTLQQRLFILQTGLWYEPKLVDNPDVLAEFHAIADQYVSENPDDESSPFYQGAQVFYLLKSGDIPAAKAKFKVLENTKDKPDYLKTYITALDYCLKSPDDEKYCDYRSTLRGHSKRIDGE